MLYPDINFSPTTGKEWRKLLRFLDNKEYAVYRKDIKNDVNFQKALVPLQQKFKLIFSPAYLSVRRPGRINSKGITESVCVWESSGLSADCRRVADQFRVPFYDVSGMVR